MKKAIALFIIIVSMVSCVSALADVYEKPILFRNAEWGSNYNDALKALPEGVKMYGAKETEYWYFISDRMFDERDYAYKANLGCYTYAQSSSLKNVKVAGYEIEQLYLYFAYLPGDDGLLIKNEANTSLIYACYQLEPKDPDAAYDDLLNKLTSLYGDVDLSRTRTPYISYTQNAWYGNDNTIVSLTRHKYPSGTDEIYIWYGTQDADNLLTNAYNAVVLEEMRNAATDTDGL